VSTRRLGWRSLALAGALATFAASASPPAPHDLYRRGQVQQAIEQAQSELTAAVGRGQADEIWSHLMYVAWLEESMGQHRAALRHANRALEVAVRSDKPFQVGRSLCWIGWSYTSLGLYELALDVYGRAIEIGTRDGEVEIAAVWGLATQETGALHARQGRLDEAERLLRITTDYARRHGIDVGIAEGGAHLAAIALERGDLDGAEALAEEALAAALRCDCSPFNTSRALVAGARVALARGRLDPRFRGQAIERARSALEHAEKHGDRRHAAEARLVWSRAVDPEDFEQRLELVSEAVELLAGSGNEMRGTAEARLGSLFLENEQTELAETYLRNGFEINRELFRRLDAAYVQADLAELDARRHDTGGSLEKWAEAAAQAQASGALPLLADLQERLHDELDARGFALLALHWGELALASLDELLAMTRAEPERRALQERMLPLADRLAEMRLTFEREAPPGGAAPGH